MTTSFGHLIQDAKFIIEAFRKISYSHVHCEGNFVVYNIAKHAIYDIGLLVWMEDVSSHLSTIIQANSNLTICASKEILTLNPFFFFIKRNLRINPNSTFFFFFRINPNSTCFAKSCNPSKSKI